MFLPYQGRRALVTGGAGFIGSHLVRRLIEWGAEVVVLDDLSTGHRANVPDATRFVEGSILDDRALSVAMDGASVVFHLAAIVSVADSVERPEHCHLVNVEGTVRVLEAARHAGRCDFVVITDASAS